MSTRCNIHFQRYGEVRANIYRHSDGYPEGVLPDLRKFFEDVEAQTEDTRFTDAEYLAAKFIVWQADQLRQISQDVRGGTEVGILDFVGVSPCTEDHDDIEYAYTVDCDNLDDDGRPSVLCEELR